MVTETEIAYLAGILDGEGCLTIELRKGTGKYEGRRYTRPLVHVVNTDLGLLAWIQERFGGRINPQPVGKASERAKPCYRLTWHNATAVDLVRVVQPYLVIKGRQADALIRFSATGNWIGRTIPDEVYDERQALLDEVRDLNRKGVRV